MSVQSHLDGLASNLNLKQSERENINRSVNTIADRLNLYFNDELKEHFTFGSYTRGTILPRKVDSFSDIDYMVIFKNPNNYKPNTLLSYLRDFVSYYYKSSEIYRSHPTIVLELNHIRFELVPAKKESWGTIYIPSPSSSFEDWMITEPNAFNQKLTNANVNNLYKIKPLVRLMKYWNRLNDSYLSSYKLEEWIVDNYYFGCINLKDYIYNVFDRLTYDLNDPQWYKNKVDKAKKIVETTREYEEKDMPFTAESEIKKLFPDL